MPLGGCRPKYIFAQRMRRKVINCRTLNSEPDRIGHHPTRRTLILKRYPHVGFLAVTRVFTVRGYRLPQRSSGRRLVDLIDSLQRDQPLLLGALGSTQISKQSPVSLAQPFNTKRRLSPLELRAGIPDDICTRATGWNARWNLHCSHVFRRCI